MPGQGYECVCRIREPPLKARWGEGPLSNGMMVMPASGCCRCLRQQQMQNLTNDRLAKSLVRVQQHFGLDTEAGNELYSSL